MEIKEQSISARRITFSTREPREAQALRKTLLLHFIVELRGKKAARKIISLHACPLYLSEPATNHGCKKAFFFEKEH